MRALLLLLLTAGAASAAPLDAALRLVPDDASLCVAVRDLRGHVRAVKDSPFLKQLRGQPAAEKVRQQPDVLRLASVASWGLGLLGTSTDELLDDVLGDAVVFAYLPAKSDPARPEAGLLAIAPRDPAALLKLVGRLNDLQKTAGDLRGVDEVDHGSRRVTLRRKANGEAEAYAVVDGVFVYSGEPWAVRAALDRADAPAPSAAAAGFARLGMLDAFGALWVAPRAFDAELRAGADGAGERDRPARRAVADFWGALDAVGLAVRLSDELRVEVALATAADRLPAPAKPWLTGPAVGPPLRGPADPLLAAGGRVDVPALLSLLESLLPPAGAAELRKAVDDTLGPVVGRDHLPAVLAGLGPTWGAWLFAPAESAHLWPAGAVAVEVPDDGVARRVVQALDLGTQLLRVRYNQEHRDQIDWNDEGGTRVLRNPAGFAAGLAPCYARRNGCIVVATSPEALARLTPATGPAGPLASLSGEAWARYFTGRLDRLAPALAAPESRDPAAVRRDLGRLEAVAGALASMELHRTSAAGRWAVELRVRPRLALK